MSDTIKGVMTKDGVKPIDYRALANLPTIDSTPTNKSTNAIQSGAVYTALTGKLGTTAQAADSAKLGGKSPDYYAKADHSHSAGEIAGGVLSVAKGGTGATTAEEALKNLGAMPTSGGMFTGGIGFLKETGIAFTTSENVKDNTTILLALDDNGFYINRWVDGAWVDDILKFNWNTGDVVDGKLMPKSGGTFTGSIAFAEGAEITDKDGNKLSEALAAIATTAGAAMPKANFSFDASTGTLNITL